MRNLIVAAGLLTALSSNSFAQTTQTSGNWSDPTIWSGGAVPVASGTVSVNNPVTIDANLSPTGSWTFASNVTDQPGGTAYTFNPGAGTNTITVNAGEIVSFEGGTSGSPNLFSSGTIQIYGTLILGYTQLNNSGNLNITVEAGGTLIINGDLTNKNNAGTFTVNGAVIVNGNFDNQTGSIAVGGSGTINTTGTLTSSGGSTVFGSTNDCNTGPCSGSTLNCTFTNTITPVSKVLCSGGAGITLTSVNSATSPTYQWLSSTDGVIYSNASGASNGPTYTTPGLTQTTWYKVVVKSTSGPCTSTSAEVRLTVLSGGGWLGATSNDWGTASNWCANIVPGSATDVTITNASGIANMPTINAGTAASARNLTISNTYPASSLTIAASGTASLSLYGDLTINGGLTDNSTAATAGVILAGSVAQNIQGTIAPVFNNLTVNNPSGAFPAVNLFANNLAVNSNLTLTSGIVNLAGYTATLGSSAASAGALNYSSGSWLYNGNIVRWFPNTAIALGSNASLFPIGDNSNYRPMYFGSSGLTAGGTIKVSHTSVGGATAVSFADGASNILVRSNSYWTVNTGNGISGSGSPFTVRSEGTGFGVIGNVSDLRLTLSSAAASGVAGVNANTVGDPQVNRSAFPVASLGNTYYWGSVNPGYTTLPVKLVSFTAQPQSGAVVLNWQTATEDDCAYFSLERSTDGTTYAPLARVPAAGGPGMGHLYAYSDENPYPGKDYYRLKIVDGGGAATYSGIALAYMDGGNGFVLFPNPSDGKLVTVKVGVPGGKEYTVDIFNDQGMLVKHAVSTNPNLMMVFHPALVPGVYVARISAAGYSVASSFLVKR